MDILSVMGIVEVLKILKNCLLCGMVWWKPGLIFGRYFYRDCMHFNLRLSKTIKQKQLPIKTVQYVSPSVWAWRQGRIHGIKASIVSGAVPVSIRKSVL